MLIFILLSLLFQLCRDGVCSSSICAKYNQVECTLKDASPCQIHCQVKDRPETCTSTEKLESLFAEPVYRPYGAPCDMVIEVRKIVFFIAKASIVEQ